MPNKSIPLSILQKLVQEQEQPCEPFTPLSTEKMAIKKSTAARLVGEQILREGKVGVIVMAGGSGTRLGWHGPKGTFPLTRIKNKSLFQLLSEKASFAANAYGATLPIAYMTSDDNEYETKAYFQKHNYFGLSQNLVSFFSQSSLPLLDTSGNILFAKDGTPLTGPDGNGRALFHFYESGVYNTWKKNGVEYISLMVVDNALADPFDAELIGHHVLKKQDITMEAIARKDPYERLGVIVEQNEHLSVIEYSEISDQERQARSSDGSLLHPVGNISFFIISMDFIEKAADHIRSLPLHKAFKQIPEEIRIAHALPEQKIWKFEYFIFDILALTKKAQVVIAPREECFAPLKNKEGSDSKETVQEFLLQRERRLLEEVAHVPTHNLVFELSPAFYYPTALLQEKWQGKLPETDYID